MAVISILQDKSIEGGLSSILCNVTPQIPPEKFQPKTRPCVLTVSTVHWYLLLTRSIGRDCFAIQQGHSSAHAIFTNTSHGTSFIINRIPWLNTETEGERGRCVSVEFIIGVNITSGTLGLIPEVVNRSIKCCLWCMSNAKAVLALINTT